MCKLKDHQGFFSSLLGICLLSFASLLWVAPSAAESGALAKAGSKPSQNFTVSTNDGLISVTATEVPLKDVVERIGQVLGIEVQAQIVANEKVTAEFHHFFLDHAMKRLSDNNAYAIDSNGARLVKLFVYPKSDAISVGHDVAANKQAKLFKFEFHPREYIRQVHDWRGATRQGPNSVS